MLVQILESHTLTKLALSPLARTFSAESNAKEKTNDVPAVHDLRTEYEVSDQILIVLS